MLKTEDVPEKGPVSEDEKWKTEKAFRERELVVKEREQTNRDAELKLKQKEQAVSGWRNPLVVAIIAATMAAVGNAVVSIVNGNLERKLESQKSEETRILEMIKTNNPDKAAENLEFLLKAGLISDSEQRTKLEQFLATRKPGSGPSLPSQVTPVTNNGITGSDDAVEVKNLPTNSGLRKSSMAVGQMRVTKKDGTNIVCTAFLVANDLALTLGSCIDDASVAELRMNGENTLAYKINLPPLEIATEFNDLNYAVLSVEGTPGAKHGMVRLSSQPPEENQPLSFLMFRMSTQQLAVTGTDDCKVLKVRPNVFDHRCDSGAGSAGAPLFSAAGNQAIGIHAQTGPSGGVAVRMDRVVNVSKILRSR